MTAAWVVGAWMIYDYSGSLGPGSYMGAGHDWDYLGSLEIHVLKTANSFF